MEERVTAYLMACVFDALNDFGMLAATVACEIESGADLVFFQELKD